MSGVGVYVYMQQRLGTGLSDHFRWWVLREKGERGGWGGGRRQENKRTKVRKKESRKVGKKERGKRPSKEENRWKGGLGIRVLAHNRC